MTKCPWLPPLEIYEPCCEWIQYENKIYEIFSRDFIETYPIYNNKQIKIRHYPMEFGKEEAFFHVTCQVYSNSNRDPDFRRCERIRWVRKFIENYTCCNKCDLCGGIKIWEKPYKNTCRVHFLLEEEKYMVVLEERLNYYLLITAFYIERNHTLRKKIKEYQKYNKNRKRP